MMLFCVLSIGASACKTGWNRPDAGWQGAEKMQNAQEGQEGEGKQGEPRTNQITAEDQLQENQTEAQKDTSLEGQTQDRKYEPQLPTEKEDADIFIEPVEDLPEDFIRGMDVSSVIALEESGVVYYNEQGEREDLFRILADAGVSYIRVRVWNDPYDKNGNGYGGGNSDVVKAAEIGARAARNGMKLLVDFQYSDFWADLQKQNAPKAWARMRIKEKQQAMYEYTKESLQTILEAGGDVGIVQIGNEINDGLAGEKKWKRVMSLLTQGSRAVREAAREKAREMKVAVHFTGVEDHDQMASYAQTLEEAGLDYDIFGVSYYPYWHGSMEHMTTVLKDIRNAFGKETLVLETAYCYTLEDGDGFVNRVGKKDLIDGYTASVQSQASCIRDVMAAAAKASALGVFYWEGAWIPVGASDQMKENRKLWEQYGSGLASSCAAEYLKSFDQIDTGQHAYGCDWENQAMFDASGHPLASLNVFKYLEYGTSCAQTVDYVRDATAEVLLREELRLPETVEVVYNDRSLNGTAAVVWDNRQAEKVRTDRTGTYTVTGRLEDGTPALCHVIVAKKNWLLNPGFEKNDVSMWKVFYQGDTNPTKIQEKQADAKSGTSSFYFQGKVSQNEDKLNVKIEQTVSGLKAGTYTASVRIQGKDNGIPAKIYLYAVSNGKMKRSKLVKLTGWGDWKKPVIRKLKLNGRTDLTIGVKVVCADGSSGSIDDFALVRAGNR